MVDVKLSELTTITEVKDNDYFIVVDSSDSNNTKKVLAINKEEKIGVFGYISTPLPTTISASDTYYTLAGTFTNTILSNFTVSETGIKYTGTEDIVVETEWSGSFTSDTNNTTFSIALMKNGVLESCSTQTLKLDNAGTYGTLSGICVGTISTNDEILIKVKADKVGCEITANTFNSSLQKFY